MTTLTQPHCATLEESRNLVDGLLSSIRQSAASITSTLQAQVIQNSKVLCTLATMMEDGLILLDRDSNITVFNPTASSLFGVEESDALGKQFDQVFPDLARRLQRSATIKDLPTRDAHGRIRAVNLSSKRVSAETEQESDYSVILARRSTNASDGEGPELYNRTMHHHPLPAFYCDRYGNSLRGSQEFCSLLGVTPQELSGKNVRDFIPAECVHWFFRQEERDTARFNIKTARGPQEFAVHKSVIRSEDGSGRPIGFIACLVKQPVQSTEVTFASAFFKTIDALDTPMMLLSFSEGRILLVNKAFCDRYHYDRARVTNQGVASLLADSPQSRMRRHLVTALAAGKEPVGVFKILDAHGQKFSIRIKAIAITTEGASGRYPKYCLLSEC